MQQGRRKAKGHFPPGQTAQISTVILDNSSEASAWGAFLSRFPKKMRLVQSPGLIRPLPSPLTQASASLPNEAETPFRCREGFPADLQPHPTGVEAREGVVAAPRGKGDGSGSSALASPPGTPHNGALARGLPEQASSHRKSQGKPCEIRQGQM